MYKNKQKLYVIIVLVLALSFAETAFASLTLTSNAINGDSSSLIDLGTGNTLSLQTTSNAPITTGTGLVTLGGGLSVVGSSAIPTISGNTSVAGVLGVAGTTVDTKKYINVNVSNIDTTPGSFYGGYFRLSGNGNNENSLIGLRGEATRASGAFGHGAVVGVLGNAYLNSGISTDNISALIGETQNLGGDVNQAYGVFTSVLSYTATANIDTAFGVYSDVNAITNGVIGSGRALYGRVRSSGGGAITNAYGLYLENITAGTTNNYAIYSLGGKSYFAGDVGIGTATPNANAALDVSSTTKAFMPPRMTTAQRDAIPSPTAGMLIYNSTTNKLNVYTTTWEAVTSL